MHISATGVWLRRLRRGGPAGLRRERRCSRCCLSRPGEEPCYQQAEDEPADVGEERHAAPVRRGAEQPKLASMSWYKNHSPRKIQAGIRTRKIGKIHVRIRDLG